MAPTPAELRAAADDLRRAASFIVLAFDDVRPRSGAATWAGPASDAFRAGLGPAEGRVAAVSAGFGAVAARLEERADRIDAEAAAAAREAEARRAREAACRRREATFAGGEGHGPLALGGTWCGAGDAPPGPGAGDGAAVAGPASVGGWRR